MHRLWWRQRLCAFDLETTGTDPCEARIVTACVVHVGAGRPTEKRAWTVDPGIEIPAEASAIHGVTTDYARKCGAPAVTAVAQIADELREAWANGEPVVIMNASYDLTVLDRDLRRNGQGPLELGPVIDPRVLDKQADQYVGYHRKGSRKLRDLCEHYRAALDCAHEAFSDAIAAARVAYRIGQIHPQIGEASLDELQELQARWYAEQAQSLEEYFRRQGKAEAVNREWPLRRAA